MTVTEIFFCSRIDFAIFQSERVIDVNEAQMMMIRQESIKMLDIELKGQLSFFSIKRKGQMKLCPPMTRICGVTRAQRRMT